MMAWHAALAVAVLAAAAEGNDVFLKGKDGKHENQIRVGKSTAMTKVRQRLFSTTVGSQQESQGASRERS